MLIGLQASVPIIFVVHSRPTLCCCDQPSASARECRPVYMTKP